MRREIVLTGSLIALISTAVGVSFCGAPDSEDGQRSKARKSAPEPVGVNAHADQSLHRPAAPSPTAAMAPTPTAAVGSDGLTPFSNPYTNRLRAAELLEWPPPIFARYNSIIESQTRDSWTLSEERRLVNFGGSRNFEGLTPTDVRCGETLCRVTIAAENQVALDGLPQAFANAGLFKGSTYQFASSGLETLLYVSRPGYQLPSEDGSIGRKTTRRISRGKEVE